MLRLFPCVARISPGIAYGAPVQDYRINTVELEISPFMHDINCFNGQIKITRNRVGYPVVLAKWNVSPKGTAPGVEFPVLNCHFPVFNNIKRTIVPHPGAVIRYLVPDDVFMIGFTTSI